MKNKVKYIILLALTLLFTSCYTYVEYDIRIVKSKEKPVIADTTRNESTKWLFDKVKN